MNILMLMGLMGRLVYLMVYRSEHYQEKADALHERERSIKAARGKIIDRTGMVLATNRTVCTISVIHSQKKANRRGSCQGVDDAVPVHKAFAADKGQLIHFPHLRPAQP